MKNTIIPMLVFLMVLGSNTAYAESEASNEIEAKLQQLQQALAQQPNDANLLNKTASAFSNAGQYAKAELLYKKSLAIREKTLGKHHPDFATSLSNLGLLYRIQGKYEQAEPLLIQSLAIDEEALGKNHPDVATDLNNLAALYYGQSKYEKAEPFYLKSAEIREKTLGENHPAVAQVLNNLAVLYYGQGKYEKAEALYLRSLAIVEKALGQEHPDFAQSLNNLAALYYEQHKYPQAEALFLQSLAIDEKLLGENHPDVARSLNNLAALYHGQNKYEQAEPLYIRSLAIRERMLGENHPDVAQSLNNLAGLYLAQGHYDKAESLQIKSLKIQEQVLGEDHPDIALSLNNLAGLYDTQGKYAQAEPLHRRSLRLSNQTLNRWLWGAGEKTRQAYLQQQNYNRNLLLSFYSVANTPEEAFYFSLSRKGLLLRISSEISALSKQSTNPAIQKQVQEFNRLKMQLASLAFSGKPEDKAKFQTLEEKSNRLEMQLSQKISAFKRSKTEVTPQEVLEKLKPEQSVIDFLIYQARDLKPNTDKESNAEHVIALVASKESRIKLIKLGELAPISEAIKSYRQTILPTAQGQLAHRAEVLNPASQKLYDLLWQPLLPYIASKKEVFLVPDGILHLLPFKALQDKQGHFLAEKQQITLLSSARDIVLPPLSAKQSEAVIFAAPLFGDKDTKTNAQPTRSIATRQQDIYFAPLEGAAAEGQALSQLIKAKQAIRFFQGSQANEATVAAIKSPRLLHFATHGFFLENLPQPAATSGRAALLQSSDTAPNKNSENSLTRSGLALTGANSGINGNKQADGSDGILTALEVLGLYLEGTDLVTLSACETGVGDIQVGEGVYSLNRAFQEAGAKSVLSTLWSVADDQTKLFMQNFYTLVLNGETPQQALQKTQLKFIKDKNLQDPFFWAAFTVVGI